MLLNLGDVSLWFDVSGPSVLLQGDHVVDRPGLVAVHGGPGLDHSTLRGSLAPLEEHMQITYYDQRGHGRSDHSSEEFWKYRVWADDLRRFCDALGMVKPLVLGSSFGGFITMAYAALYSDHPGGIIMTNTTGGHADDEATYETFRRLGGDEAADVARRDFSSLTEDSANEFNRVCLPLFSAKPGYAEASRQMLARAIHTTEVNLYYFRNEARQFDPWTLLPKITCPVLILAGEDDPMCPVNVVEELARQLPAGTTRLVRLPGARHAVFRDRPDLAFPAVREFSEAIRAAQ